VAACAHHHQQLLYVSLGVHDRDEPGTVLCAVPLAVSCHLLPGGNWVVVMPGATEFRPGGGEGGLRQMEVRAWPVCWSIILMLHVVPFVCLRSKAAAAVACPVQCLLLSRANQDQL